MKIKNLATAWIISCVLGWLVRYWLLNWTGIGEMFFLVADGPEKMTLYSTIDMVSRIFQGISFLLIADALTLRELLMGKKEPAK